MSNERMHRQMDVLEREVRKVVQGRNYCTIPLGSID